MIMMAIAVRLNKVQALPGLVNHRIMSKPLGRVRKRQREISDIEASVCKDTFCNHPVCSTKHLQGLEASYVLIRQSSEIRHRASFVVSPLLIVALFLFIACTHLRPETLQIPAAGRDIPLRIQEWQVKS